MSRFTQPPGRSVHLDDARGQAATEYAVLLGTVGALALTLASLLGASLRDVLQQAAQRMLSAVTGMPGT
ncbi:MAG: hypothetical protein AB1806_09145 [Acidobacteriota bacterium]